MHILCTVACAIQRRVHAYVMRHFTIPSAIRPPMASSATLPHGRKRSKRAEVGSLDTTRGPEHCAPFFDHPEPGWPLVTRAAAGSCDRVRWLVECLSSVGDRGSAHIHTLSHVHTCKYRPAAKYIQYGLCCCNAGSSFLYAFPPPVVLCGRPRRASAVAAG